LLAIVALGCGCAGTASYVNPDADLDYYQRVAVAPFWTVSGDRFTGQRVADAFTAELLLADRFDVMEPGQFRHILAEVVDASAASARGMTAGEIKKVGQEAGVQAIFVGSVLTYDMQRIGQNQFPVITVEVRMLDVETGRLIWNMQVTRKGGPTVPLFGFGEVHTLGELTRKVCHELVAHLP